MHPYSDTGCEIVWLCVKPCQMCSVQTRTALLHVTEKSGPFAEKGHLKMIATRQSCRILAFRHASAVVKFNGRTENSGKRRKERVIKEKGLRTHHLVYLLQSYSQLPTKRPGRAGLPPLQ
jgi:hypothetical protein